MANAFRIHVPTSSRWFWCYDRIEDKRFIAEEVTYNPNSQSPSVSFNRAGNPAPLPALQFRSQYVVLEEVKQPDRVR